MKVFVIGGDVPGTDLNWERQRELLSRVMGDLGRQLAEASLPLIVCSPYDGAADIEALRGWSAALTTNRTSSERLVEIHCPDDTGITEAVVRAQDDLGLTTARVFRHPSSRTPNGELDIRYSWLLAQLSAMQRCNAIVTMGGNPGGSANLLLHLAAARRVPILPLGHIGGAAGAHLERHRYELQDRLGDGFEAVKGPQEPTSFRTLLEALINPEQAGAGQSSNRSFFISYARERPAEADLVEMTLRRRNCVVYRDEHAFDPGGDVLAAITEGIHKADVFLALWCREYACSPWCNDELELALDRGERGALRVVILDLDGTRIVPRRARGLIACPARSRPEIEASLLRVVGPDRPEA